MKILKNYQNNIERKKLEFYTKHPLFLIHIFLID